MYAYIDECAEIYHVSHSSGELHTLFNIGYIQNVRPEHGLRKRVADIPTGLYKLGYYIVQRRHTDAELVGEL